jgi:GntR family transcriptional repressor for pyruvate dehydrogenase complex
MRYTRSVPPPPAVRRPEVGRLARTSVGDAVHDQLRQAILSDQQPAGSLLPAERVLAASAGVNRQAVREAVQRLRQAGLVEVLHGEGVRVRDWRRSGTIGLLLDNAVRRDGTLDPELILSLLQLRLVVLVDAARLAARRRTPELDEELARMIAAMHAEPPDAPVTPRFDFWERVVDASGNVAYRLAFNAQFAVARKLSAETLAVLAAGARLLDHYEALADAIAGGDEERAALEAGAIISPIVHLLEGA